MSRRLFPRTPVLIVDDDPIILRGFKLVLRSGGITRVRTIEDPDDVIPFVSDTGAEVILLDVIMPKRSGYDLLKQISGEFPDIPVIMITGNNEVDMAVKCMKEHAFDYMVKPIEKNRLISGVKRAIEFRRLNMENRLLKDQFNRYRTAPPHAFDQIITASREMKRLFSYMESVASSLHPILITGETGTGKELMAKAVHDLHGEDTPFVSVNVAGIDDNAFSDTLFGHIKGAFTGAEDNRPGLIEQAASGTLFLDEIGDLRPESQIKLLRLVQENEYFALGSDVPKLMNARVIVATNQDLNALQDSGKFRKDLYFRLSPHHIHIPPLRERREDIPLLLDYFLDRAAKERGKPAPAYPRELHALLTNYEFPGNVRELEGMVFDALSVHKSKIMSMQTFKTHIRNTRGTAEEKTAKAALFNFSDFSTLPTMAQAQMLLMKEAVRRSGNNKSMAARMLGISRQRLIRHLKSDE
ncbi:MAG: sigma-54 dependent transcriptional regulator [Desulfobacterales bacterium]|nr:sigma-54 dependent transcriptional regulator [Desulfobacterales bacterium]